LQQTFITENSALLTFPVNNLVQRSISPRRIEKGRDHGERKSSLVKVLKAKLAKLISKDNQKAKDD
jgi:hypothetical protein